MSKTLPILPISILLMGLALVGLGDFLGAPLESAKAVTRNMTLEGWTTGWNRTTSPNPTITVVQGDSVVLSLPNLDSAPHQFFIDVDANLALPPICPPDKCSGMLPTNYQFAVDFAPGTYKYYCTFHSGQMKGDLVVQGFTTNSNPDSLRVVRASSNMSTITVTSVNNFVGKVNLTAAVSPSGPTATLNPTNVTLSPNGMATSTLNVSATSSVPTGTSYVVTVTAMSGSSSSLREVVTLVVAPDFSVSADPTLLIIPLDSSRNSIITLTSRDTFFGQVDLTISTLPTGITATLTPNPVNLASGGIATSTLNVTVSSLTMPRSYIVNVTGTGGSFTHSTTVTVVAGPDFGISSDPATLTLASGSSGTSTIMVTSFNNFTGTVNLTGIVSPDGPTLWFNPPSVAFSGSGMLEAVLTVNTSTTITASNYTMTITGASGPVAHSATITLSVTDFSLTVSNANLILQQGSSMTTTVSITSLNGFADVVNLTTTASSSALSPILNVTTLSLNPSGIGIASLTLSAASAPAGTYTVSITGTSGSLVRTVSLSITVQPSRGETSILPLIGGVTGGAIAIATAGFYLMRRRRFREKTPGSQIPT